MINFKITKPKGRKKNYTLTIDNSKSNVPVEYANEIAVSVIGSKKIMRNSSKIIITKVSPETFLPEIRKKIYSPANVIEGGIGANRTIDDLAKKYNVRPIHYKKIYAAIDAGIGVEKEHSPELEKMKEIAFDHLWETGMLYYHELSKMEKKLESNPVKFEKGAEVGDDNDRMRMLALKAKADADALELLELEAQAKIKMLELLELGETKVETDEKYGEKTTMYYKIKTESLDKYLNFLKGLKEHSNSVKVFSAGIGVEYLIVTGIYDKNAAMHPDISIDDFDDYIFRSSMGSSKNIISFKRLNSKPTPENSYNGKWNDIDDRIKHIQEVLSEEEEVVEANVHPETAPQKEAWEMTREEFEIEKPAIKGYKGKFADGKEFTTDLKEVTTWINFAGEKATGYKFANSTIPFDVAHKQAIQQALSEGKPVPAEVLADYPELQKSEPETNDEVKQIEKDLISGKMTASDYIDAGYSKKYGYYGSDDFKKKFPDFIKHKKSDKNIGREWNSPYGRQKITDVIIHATGDMYVVETVDTGAERNYSVGKIEDTIKNDEYRLTDEYKVKSEEQQQLQKSIREAQERRDAELKKERDELYVFLKDSPAMQKERLTLAMLKSYMLNGKTNTLKKHIEEFIRNGAVVKTVDGERRLYVEERGFFDQKTISKVGMDYAEYLLLNKEKMSSGGFIKCPTGTRVQSVLMSKDIFSRKEAVKWVKEHDYKAEIDETENYYRFRQQEPEQFEEESFRTIEFTDGIKAVIGCPLNKKMERGDSVKYDRAGNPIGEGSWHIEPEVFEFSEYPQIKSSVDYSQSTESTYVTYRNTENDKKITVRFSQHESNAVKFGDQLNGYFATKDEVLYHLGLKKREFIPKTFLSIPNMQVAKKKLGNYEEADKTIQEMYALGANADISMYNGKIAKGSNYLIMGDTVEEIIDTRQGSFGNPVELGKYVYSDIDENNKKAESGMKINDGTILYRVTKNENLTKENIRLPFHAGTLEQAERISDIKDYGNDAVYYKIILDENARIYTTSDTVANILDKEIRKEITVSIGKNILNDCISVVMRNVKTNEIIPFIHTNGEATPFVNLQDKDASDFLHLYENMDYDAIRYENEIEGDGYSYLILTDKFKIEKMSGAKAEQGMKIDADINGGAAYEGNLHTEGGIPATVKETGQEIEFEVGEIVINRVDAQKHCEELSKINSEHGKKIDCECLRNSNKDENLKDPKMEGEIDETGMVKLEKGAEIDKNMEKTLSNESNIIQDAIENQELEIEEMETATMFENGDKIGGKQRHYKFRDDSFFVVDWVEQDGKQVAILVDKQPRKKWFSIGESSADQILEDAKKEGLSFDEMLKTLIQNGAFVNIHAKGAAISGEYPHPFVKAIDEQIIKAGKEYRAIEDAIYGLAGDRNKQKRQEVISAIVGDKVPAAKSGISAIEEELKKWILAKYPNANVTKRFEPILKEEAKADTTEKEAWEMTLDEYVEEKSKDIPEGSISDLRAEFHNEYYNAIQKHLESNGQISQRVYEQLEPIFQNRVVAKYRTPISGTEPKTETIPENIPIEVAKSKEYQEAYRKYEMGLISLDELKSFGKEQPQTAPETEHMEKVKTKTADIEWENILLSMIPNAQKKMMSVSEDFEVNKERLITQLKAMPKLYGQDGKKGDAIAYFHYFVGSLDIYLMEFSKSDDESSPYEFYTFGSAVEGGDFEGSYAYFPDWLSFTPKNIEFDYYFEPTPLRNIQDERNPYYEKEQEAPTVDKEMVNIRTKIYANAYEQNKGIEKFIELAGENTVFTGEDIEFMNRYTGYGGLGKFMDVETVQRTEAVGTLYEYYTPDELCKKLWGLAYKHGFDASQLVLEPSCGIGRIIKYAPNKSLVKAYETNPTSSFIAKATYRGSDIVNDYFESEFYMGFGKRTRNKDYAPAYGLVIGNYPFGDYSGKYASMGEKDYSKATQVDHHFIVRGLDALVSGGLMVCIVNSRFMQGGHDAVKAEIEKRGELIDAYRLPAGVFQNTEVIADILVIRKK